MINSNEFIQLVTFQLGQKQYGIDIMDVREIVEYNEIREIPNAPPYIEGIHNLRGDIVPIVNLSWILGIRETEEEKGTYLLICSIKSVLLGFIIDTVLRVISVDESSIQTSSSTVSTMGMDSIKGLIHQEEDYMVVLDSHRLLELDDVRQVADSIA